MKQKLGIIALWLFIINLAIALGAGIYEHRIVLPQWLTSFDGFYPSWNAAAALEANVGLRFWAFVTSGPLTLLTLANLAFAWAMDPGVLRRTWLSAGLLALADRILTFAYFIPAMLRLMAEDLAPEVATTVALQWSSINHLRHILIFLALVMALRAFARYYMERGTRHVLR